MLNLSEVKYAAKSQIRINWGKLTFFLRKYPDFLIVGSQKAGTTSLYNYIAQHSKILQPKEKELHYFDNRFHRKSSIWYRACMPIAKKGYYTFEATPGYMFHPKCAERIWRLLPNIKLIFILRNPIDRAYSHYQMNKRGGIEPFDFNTAIEKEKDRLRFERNRVFNDDNFEWKIYSNFSYLERGKYILQIKRFLNFFPQEHLFITTLDDLEINPEAVLSSIFDFLNLEQENIKINKKFNSFEYSKDIDTATIKKLKEYFSQYNEELFSFLGKEYRW